MVCPLPMGKGASSYAWERSSLATNSCRGTAVIAARTAASRMPRRRNCFSTISNRSGAYSSLSSMGNRCRVLFPRAYLEDFFHLREREVAFVLGVVKMRREAHARFGTKVDKDLPGDEFAADFISMRTVYGNGSGTLLRFVWR